MEPQPSRTVSPDLVRRVHAIERPHPNLLKQYAILSLFGTVAAPIVFVPLYFRYHTLRFRFDEEGVGASWGILFRREVYLSYKRIQDIHVKRNLIERWLGLGTVEIQTAAGSSGSELSLDGLSDFEGVRDYLYALMRGHETVEEPKSAASEAPTPESEAATLLRAIREELAATRRALEGAGAVIGDRIYERGKSLALELLKAPSEPPELPAGSHASVEVIRASPRFLAYRMVLLAIGAGIVFLALLVAIVGAAVAGQWWGIALAVLALVVVALFFIAHWFAIRVDYDLRYYVLTDRSLRVREGAWIVREKTLTYANVQNLARHQGPIQRLLGISDLRVEAAGGGGGGSEGKQGLWNEHGATIAGVENAAEIGETIRGYLRGRRDAGLGDPDDARRAPKGLGADAAALAELRLLAEEAQRLRAAAESRAARG